MNTSEYLNRQGWLGSGHSLDPSGHGIIKPILVSKKPNGFGLGRKQNDVHADQWWSRIFDNTLKSLHLGKDGAGKRAKPERLCYGVPPPANIPQDGARWAGNLYETFVRGEGLVGTLGSQSTEQTKSKPIPNNLNKWQIDKNLNNHDKSRRKKKKVRKLDKSSDPATSNVMLENHHSGKRRNEIGKSKDRSQRPKHILIPSDLCPEDTNKTYGQPQKKISQENLDERLDQERQPTTKHPRPKPQM